MNSLKTILFILIGSVLIIACQNDPRSEQLELIKQTEKELYSSESFNRDNAIKLIDLYYNFAQQFADDSLAAPYLYKAAEVAMNIQQGSKSIAYFDQLLEKYPDYEKAAECVFLKAFVYENQLKNIEKAGELYRFFIDTYPEHPLTNDAEASIKFLGKSPEELVKIFQEMNQE